MLTYLYVAVGGAIGSAGRHWMAGAVDDRFNDALPWGTLAVNVLGSLAIGVLAGLGSLSGEARLLLMVGLCGGFTTFSAFSLQTVELLRDGALGRAAANALASVCVCIAATWIGLAAIERTALG